MYYSNPLKKKKKKNAVNKSVQKTCGRERYRGHSIEGNEEGGGLQQ